MNLTKDGNCQTPPKRTAVMAIGSNTVPLPALSGDPRRAAHGAIGATGASLAQLVGWLKRFAGTEYFPDNTEHERLHLMIYFFRRMFPSANTDLYFW